MWHCPQAVLHSDNREQGAWSWIGIRQRCIRGPGAVRLHVESSSVMINDGGSQDQAPNGAYSFSHLVRFM